MTEAKKPTQIDPAVQLEMDARSERCMKRIQDVLREERCRLSFAPMVHVNGKIPVVFCIPMKPEQKKE